MSEPQVGPRICDCPCHRGADVFHIVSCCGSVLGRRPTREAMLAREVEIAGAKTPPAPVPPPEVGTRF